MANGELFGLQLIEKSDGELHWVGTDTRGHDWHVLHLRRPLIDVMRGSFNLEDQVKEFVDHGRDAIRVLLAGGELEELHAGSCSAVRTRRQEREPGSGTGLDHLLALALTTVPAVHAVQVSATDHNPWNVDLVPRMVEDALAVLRSPTSGRVRPIDRKRTANLTFRAVLGSIALIDIPLTVCGSGAFVSILCADGPERHAADRFAGKRAAFDALVRRHRSSRNRCARS